MAITPEEFRAHREHVTSHAREVLDHVYRTVLKAPEFTLQDGTKCTVSSFYEPETNDQGELKCGIDVNLSDGSHLEFTVAQTGWGKSFVPPPAGKKPRPGRRR
jgi:hypothetical protein